MSLQQCGAALGSTNCLKIVQLVGRSFEERAGAGLATISIMTPEILIGVGWYSEDQWTMLKLVADDRDSLDTSYEQWEAGVLEALEQLRRQPGVEAIKIPVDVVALRQWCRERAKPLDRSSRAEYAVEIAKSMSEGGRNA